MRHVIQILKFTISFCRWRVMRRRFLYRQEPPRTATRRRERGADAALQGPRPSGSPTATARLRGRARLPGLGGSRRCSGRTRGSPKSCRPARRSSPSGVELSGTLFIAVSDHLAAHSHFIIQMASSASGIRPSSVCGMRCNPSWSEPVYCRGSASSMWNALQFGGVAVLGATAYPLRHTAAVLAQIVSAGIDTRSGYPAVALYAVPFGQAPPVPRVLYLTLEVALSIISSRHFRYIVFIQFSCRKGRAARTSAPCGLTLRDCKQHYINLHPTGRIYLSACNNVCNSASAALPIIAT